MTAGALYSQSPSSTSSSSTQNAKTKNAKNTESGSSVDAGAVADSVYRNKTLGLTCKIPEGWVLRTDEMNNEMNGRDAATSREASAGASDAASSAGARVLLAAFSRPPEARGEAVNSSILIAAESAAAYPGLKEAAQYFFPLTEVAKAQGFEPDADPYAVAVGTKTLVRGDFHKNVGTRVMRQSTLALLDHGYAVSITVIGGTQDEVEQLIDGVSFTGAIGKK